jgi:hypothetical protein
MSEPMTVRMSGERGEKFWPNEPDDVRFAKTNLKRSRSVRRRHDTKFGQTNPTAQPGKILAERTKTNPTLARVMK